MAVDTGGKQVWLYSNVEGAVQTPVIGADGTIYFGTETGRVYALNPDGTRKWRVRLDGAIIGGPTVGADGTVFTYGAYGGKVSALDAEGNLLWSFTPDSSIFSAPTLAPDSTLYVGTGGGILYGLDAGTTLGSGPWPTSGHDSRRTSNANSD
jgi:outer membrane protein assembly factor BamB